MKTHKRKEGILLYILLFLFSTGGVFLFADSPAVANQDSSSVSMTNVSGAESTDKNLTDLRTLIQNYSDDPKDQANLEKVYKKSVQEAYKEAVDLYKQKKYHLAHTAFEHVNAIAPNYRSTSSYLEIIAQDIIITDALAVKQQAAEVQYQQPVVNSAPSQAVEEIPARVVEMLPPQRGETAFSQADKIAIAQEKEMKRLQIKEAQSLAQERQNQRALIEERRGQEELARENKRQQALAQEQKRRQVLIQERQNRRALIEERRHQEELAREDKRRQALSLERQRLQALSQERQSQRALIEERRLQQELARENKRLQELTLERQHQQALAQDRQNQRALFEERQRQQALGQELQRQKVSAQELDRQKAWAQEHLRQQELRDKNDQLQRVYTQALGLYRDDKYEAAEKLFLQVKDMDPDYKSTQYYLSNIDDKIKQSQAAAALRQKALDQEAQQNRQLKDKADQMESIYQQALSLYRDHQWAEAEAKFRSLESMAPEYKHTRRYIQNIDKRILDDEHLKQSREKVDLEQFKQRDIMKSRDMLFNEGVNYYEHQQYVEAKLLFGELADQHDPRAWSWLKKVESVISREYLRTQQRQERERAAFLEDQLKAQRKLLVIELRERQRQKKLTEELEHHKQLYQDDQLLQLRKEQILKVQEQERESQEAKRLQLEKESAIQQEMYRFHKIKIIIKPQPAQPVIAQAETQGWRAKLQVQPGTVLPVLIVPKVVVVPPAVKPSVTTSKVVAPPVIIKPLEQTVIKKPLEAAGPIKEGKIENMKQADMIHEEDQRWEELVNEERQHHSELEIRREAARKQLEDGVEVMYQNALSLYQQRDYAAAAERFKDVQDILPGYKRSAEYMDDAHQKSLTGPQAVLVPAAPAVPAASSHQDTVSKALDLFDPNVK